MNRRHVIQSVLAGAAAAAFQDNALERIRAASSAVNGRNPEDVAADEDYWAEIRNAFSVDRNVINLNNGYVSPSPRTVQDALRRQLEYSDLGPYHTMVNVLERQVETVRRRIAQAAGCDPEEIAITRNSSESLENAQYGIDLKPGDEVLTTNQDYPRMIETFRQRERREGIVLKMISFPVPTLGMDDLYRRFEQAVTPRTKLILVCHITNRTGQIFPVKRICAMAHARNIPVICDGAHAFSHFPFRIPDLDLRLLRREPAQVDLRPHRHRLPLRAQGAHCLHLVADGLGRYAEGGYPQVRGDRHASRRQSQRHQRGAAVQREYRHRPEGRAPALPARPLGAASGAEPLCQILHSPDPAQAGGIGFLAFDNIDPGKVASALTAKYAIYTSVMGHEEYTGLRITPNIYTPSATWISSPKPWRGS